MRYLIHAITIVVLSIALWSIWNNPLQVSIPYMPWSGTIILGGAIVFTIITLIRQIRAKN